MTSHAARDIRRTRPRDVPQGPRTRFAGQAPGDSLCMPPALRRQPLHAADGRRCIVRGPAATRSPGRPLDGGMRCTPRRASKTHAPDGSCRSYRALWGCARPAERPCLGGTFRMRLDWLSRRASHGNFRSSCVALQGAAGRWPWFGPVGGIRHRKPSPRRPERAVDGIADSPHDLPAPVWTRNRSGFGGIGRMRAVRGRWGRIGVDRDRACSRRPREALSCEPGRALTRPLRRSVRRRAHDSDRTRSSFPSRSSVRLLGRPQLRVPARASMRARFPPTRWG